MGKEKSLLKDVPAWDCQPLNERLALAISALKIHGILTDSEETKAYDRLIKNYRKAKSLRPTKEGE